MVSSRQRCYCFSLAIHFLLITIKVDYSSVLAKQNDEKDTQPKYSTKIAIELDHDDENLANEIAKAVGFKNNGKIGSLKGFFEFEHDLSSVSRERRSLKAKRLVQHPRVKWAEEQDELERVKRGFVDDTKNIYCRLMKEKRNSLERISREKRIQRQKREDSKYFNDPRFKNQWYLNNYGQDGVPPNNDINVLPVYKKGITGKGVVVSVLDDGLDHTHPDLTRNYDPRASTNLNKILKDKTGLKYRDRNDPFPNDNDSYNAHGTKCAGEIGAEANNSICGAGIAPNVKLGGVRMLDGSATDSLEAHALSFNRDYIDIYSSCWGPKDDGKTFGRPGKLGMKALADGAKYGRKGKGSIFVWATGNGGSSEDNCNCDGYTSSIYTISIGAISVYGLSTFYDEKCSSTNAVIFTGDTHHSHFKTNNLVTTNLHHKCVKYFRGTSAAAPLAAGVFALVLEANPKLTWRDMQHIIVKTAKNTSECDPGWRKNAAGNRFNIKFGFGRIDADAMVTAALDWKNVPEQLRCTLKGSSRNRNIPRGGQLVISEVLSGCAITKLEHVQFIVTLRHRRRGDLRIVIKSPQGTESELLAPRDEDNSFVGLDDWAFMTLFLWGENSSGTWTVTFSDNIKPKYHTKSRDQDAEDIERQIIDGRKQAEEKTLGTSLHEEITRDKIPAVMGESTREKIPDVMEDSEDSEESFDDVYQGRTREEYMKDDIVERGDISQRDAIPLDIYAQNSPVAGYIVKYSFVFWGTKE